LIMSRARGEARPSSASAIHPPAEIQANRYHMPTGAINPA